MNTEIITEYVHGGPDARDEFSDLWPHDSNQQATFHFCLYEEPVKVEVDLATGRWRYLEFAGIELKEPSPWFPERR